MDGKRVPVHGWLVEACQRICSAATGTAEGVLSALYDEIDATGRLAVAAAYRFRKDGNLDSVHPAGPKPDNLGWPVRSRVGPVGSLQGGPGTWARTYALKGGGREWGCVLVTAPTSPDLVEETSVAVLVAQAGTALALVVACENKQACAEELAAVTAQREGRALLDDLLDGEKDGVSVQDMSARAHALGHNLRQAHRVLAVQWSGRALDDDLVRAVGHAAAALDMTCLTTRRDDSLIVLVTRPDVWCDARGWRQLHTSIALELRSCRGAIGVGEHADHPRQFSRSYRQALQALQVRTSLPNPYGITVFDELGVYRWLTGPGSSLEIATLIGEWLGPLLDYDSRRGTDLVAALSAFLEHGGNCNGTAETLHIHRSTLRYRLHRIRDLTGHDLTDPETRLHVQLAIRAWRIQYDG